MALDQIPLRWAILSLTLVKLFSSSLSQGYVLPVLGRANLKVLTGAQVLRITTQIKEGAVVATGAEFQFEGQKYTVSAGREVILSAG